MNTSAKTTSIAITDIADWFLSKEEMTHKKLQKLCYYAVAWGWALMGKSIAKNDQFEAWVHGPVSPAIFRKYTAMGWNNLERVEKVKDMPEDVTELLEAVWFTYGNKSGNELEALSHSEKPWIEARNGLANHERSSTPIDANTMREFYSSIKSTEY